MSQSSQRRVEGPQRSASLRDRDGGVVGTVDLDPEVFSHAPNVPLMHQVVNAQLAAARSGTQSTKTRAEVRGGGAKPWRQKGTGRARQGSIRAPHFSGGGVALGPKPRSYAQKTPKKMVQLALLSALSDRASDDKVVVVQAFGYETPKTKEAIAFLNGAGIDGSVLLVLGDEDETEFLAFRNVPRVHIVHESELNTFDVLRHDYVVFTQETLPTTQFETGSVPVAPPTRRTDSDADEVSQSEGSAE